MASPDDPEPTADAGEVPDAALRLPVERIELPVYRLRRSTAVRFWIGFVVAAALTALIVLLVLA
jgi:hypothetical protein